MGKRGSPMSLDAPRADVARGVPARQRRDLDDVPSVGGVNEATPSHVNAYVAETVKEDQIAGL